MSNSVHMPVWLFLGALLGAAILGVVVYRRFFR